MLENLHRIVQEVNGARNLEQALEIIVQRVKQATEVDVCSVYLTDYPKRRHVLMATDGLNPEAVGAVTLDLGKGLVGLVGERAEAVNLDDASRHPQFQFFPETGEERYHSFLGVPIIHHGKVLGVLTVQRRHSRRFNEDSVSFLMTIAAQLAGAIAHAEASGDINGLLVKKSRKGLPLEGVASAPGVTIGTAVVIYPPADLDAVPDRAAASVKDELAGLDKALAAVRGDIQTLLRRLRARKVPAEERALFEVYLLMLQGGGMVDRTRELIRAGNWAPGALRETVREHVRVFDEMEDPYLSERASDVRDLGVRILSYLQSGSGQQVVYPKNTVLVGEEISATALAEVPPKRLAAVVAVRGSGNSHVAILARALGVPAVMGITDLPVSRVDGRELIVDGYQGKVYVAPDETVRKEYRRLIREEKALSEDLRGLRDLPAETPDGVRIPLYANTGLLSDLRASRDSGAEGVGLYRTEFPFMVRDRFPGEDEQTRIYAQILKTFAGLPVVVRTLDIGGDKPLHYFPIVEDNPFLGWRGIRLTLDHPEIFLVQLRALLRASVGLDNLQLLLPMITNPGEVDESLRLLRQAHQELREEGLEVRFPPVGVMIEVPAAVYQAAALAQRVDFLSIGTNDLTQYLLAVDRSNARVAHMFDTLHPAVLHALCHVVETAHRHGKPVSVCGEMAGDPLAALLLVGMGMDSLSMNVSSLNRVKSVIRQFTAADARQMLDEVLQLEDPKAVRQRLLSRLTEAGLGGLFRSGG